MRQYNAHHQKSTPPLDALDDFRLHAALRLARVVRNCGSVKIVPGTRAASLATELHARRMGRISLLPSGNWILSRWRAA